MSHPQSTDLVKRLLTAFPHSHLINGPQEKTDHEQAWSFAGNWLAIRKHDLNQTSRAILQKLSDQNYTTMTQNNPWYQYLTQKSPLMPKTTTQRVRFIQFKITFHDDHDQKELTQAICDLFNHLLSHFYIEPTRLIIVQAIGPQSLSTTELKSILQTIESDFSIKIQAFIGNYWQLDDQLALLFHEEQAVFAKATSSVSSLATLALTYYAQPQLRQSLLAQQLNHLLNQDSEIKDVVIALYQNAGNLSSAAKQLFLHRNTLQYRLERFYETTNLNLKQMDDLVLCYLLITAFNN